MDNPGINFKNLILAPFRGQTYLNLIYLFLTFPLGLFYFIFLVVGFAVGIPLIIIWVGLLVLLIVFAAWWVFVIFERQLAIWLLRVKLPPLVKQDMTGKRAGEQVMAHLTNPVTWKGLIYLFLKFPLGTLTFVIGTFLVALSVTLLSAPILVLFSPLNIRVDFTWNAAWVVDTLPEALVLFGLGIPVAWVSLILMNGMAWLWARFSEFMLGYRLAPEQPDQTLLPTVPEAPAAPAEPVAAASPIVPTPVVSGEPLDASSEEENT